MSGIIEARNLSRWYGQIIAVNKISFSLGEGVVGLLGPNGAGKSTLMKLITGQLKPDQGQIAVLGRQVWNNSKLFNRIGFCPEQDAFYDRMTGADFLSSLLQLQGFSARESAERASSVLEAFGLGDSGTRKVGGYSKGMRQRLKLAQAVAHNPEVLILDEPLSGLDPVGRRDTIRQIREWGKTGKCVIVSSHILYEIESMTQNILLIHNGQVLAEGDIHQVRDLIDQHPHSVYVRCSNPRRLAELLVGFPDVVSIRFHPDRSALTLESRKPDDLYQRLPDVLLRNEIELDELTSPDDNLEAVFQYLVNR